MPDPGVAAIVASWPARLHSERAARLGLVPDPDFGSIIEMHLTETGGTHRLTATEGDSMRAG